MLDADDTSQLKIFSRRSALLAWPLINPHTQSLLDRNLIVVREHTTKLFQRKRYDCVLVEITQKGLEVLHG